MERTEIEKGSESANDSNNEGNETDVKSATIFDGNIEKKYVQSKLGDSPGVSGTEMETESKALEIEEKQQTEEDGASFDGYLDFDTYRRLVEDNPAILRWFTIDLHRV